MLRRMAARMTVAKVMRCLLLRALLRPMPPHCGRACALWLRAAAVLSQQTLGLAREF